MEQDKKRYFKNGYIVNGIFQKYENNFASLHFNHTTNTELIKKLTPDYEIMMDILSLALNPIVDTRIMIFYGEGSNGKLMFCNNLYERFKEYLIYGSYNVSLNNNYISNGTRIIVLLEQPEPMTYNFDESLPAIYIIVSNIIPNIPYEYQLIHFDKIL